jgi:leukotriene-A4 hydrolase
LRYCASTILLFLIASTMTSQHDSARASDLPHSCARPSEVSVSHMDFDLNVDFKSQRLSGSVTLSLNRLDDSKPLRLDSRGLMIEDIAAVDGRTLAFQTGEAQGALGRCLSIELPAGVDKVVIRYATSVDASALQWLSPEQTTDKRHPFLFTQSQAILARTWVPCQDTPAVRFTYSARITVPPELMAVMSASNPQVRNDRGVYQFEMKQPIPSYLLALAVGDLEFRQIGPRSGVYAEPSVLEKAAWELADTERMIAAAESLYGAYRWERYDVIFLPSSFPFGGMENPRLTFATPTILAGDRSLVALIAHELAHSWSGNLVTNATWNDFWLNEGFTVYFEQRIMEAVYGRPYAEMLARLTLDGLREEMRTLDDRDTWLKLDLAGRDPDDGMTAIAYDKGYFFLRMLEENIGREKWDMFLRDYFDQHAFRSMTTEDFVAYLKQNLDIGVDITEWIYGPGLPANCPEVHTAQLLEVEQQARAFINGTPATELSIQDWTTHHWLHFLRTLPDPLTTAQMHNLDEAFELTASANSEITHEWLLHVIAGRLPPRDAEAGTVSDTAGTAKVPQALVQETGGNRAGQNPRQTHLPESATDLSRGFSRHD